MFHGQAHDIGVGAVDFPDDPFPMLLNGVGTCLVQGIDHGEILSYPLFSQGLKRHACMDGKQTLSSRASMDHADPGDHVMEAP